MSETVGGIYISVRLRAGARRCGQAEGAILGAGVRRNMGARSCRSKWGGGDKLGPRDPFSRDGALVVSNLPHNLLGTSCMLLWVQRSTPKYKDFPLVHEVFPISHIIFASKNYRNVGFWNFKNHISTLNSSFLEACINCSDF